MKESKYKEGDLVEIVINKIRPSSVGKVGTITKVKPVLMFALCVLLGATVAICAVDTFVQGYETVFNLLESLTFLGAMVLWIILQQLISKDIDEDYEYLHTKQQEWIKESYKERGKLLEMKQKLSRVLFRLRFDYDKMTDEEKESIEKELDEIDTLS